MIIIILLQCINNSECAYNFERKFDFFNIIFKNLSYNYYSLIAFLFNGNNQFCYISTYVNICLIYFLKRIHNSYNGMIFRYNYLFKNKK